MISFLSAMHNKDINLSKNVGFGQVIFFESKIHFHHGV